MMARFRLWLEAKPWFFDYPPLEVPKGEVEERQKALAKLGKTPSGPVLDPSDPKIAAMGSFDPSKEHEPIETPELPSGGAVAVGPPEETTGWKPGSAAPVHVSSKERAKKDIFKSLVQRGDYEQAFAMLNMPKAQQGAAHVEFDPEDPEARKHIFWPEVIPSEVEPGVERRPGSMVPSGYGRIPRTIPQPKAAKAAGHPSIADIPEVPSFAPELDPGETAWKSPSKRKTA